MVQSQLLSWVPLVLARIQSFKQVPHPSVHSCTQVVSIFCRWVELVPSYSGSASGGEDRGGEADHSGYLQPGGINRCLPENSRAC